MSLIDKIKLLFEAVPKTPQETKCADVKTKDGLILRVNGELKEGSLVYQLSEDGSVQIVGAGDFELEDGSIISTDGTGAIIKIVAPEVPEEEMAEETPALETPATDAPETDKITAIETKCAELEAAINLLSEEMKKCIDMCNAGGMQMESEMKEVTKENKNLKKQVKELSAEPATPAVNFKKVEAKEEEKQTKKSAIFNRIVEIRESKNNK